MRHASKVAALALGLLLIAVAALWWFTLSDMERWLIVNRQVVDAHASELLGGSTPETPDALIDATVNASGGIVVISFHDDHSRALVFAPSEESKNKFMRENPQQVLRKLTEEWFESTVQDK